MIKSIMHAKVTVRKIREYCDRKLSYRCVSELETTWLERKKGERVLLLLRIVCTLLNQYGSTRRATLSHSSPWIPVTLRKLRTTDHQQAKIFQFKCRKINKTQRGESSRSLTVPRNLWSSNISFHLNIMNS